MSENQSSLRFSLEESVWFKRGQEVEELLSISLDPHITIQEQEQYIVIQGKLYLSGEYRNDEEEAGEDDVSWQKKYVQSIEYRAEEGIYEFKHQFPVDITIPKDKVEDVSCLDVSVDSFDYDIVKNLCLQLNADLTISGLRDEEENSYAGEEMQAISAFRNHEHMQDKEVEYESVNSGRSEKPSQEEEELIPIFNLSRNDSTDDDEFAEEEEELFQPFNVEVRKIPSEQPAKAFDVSQFTSPNQNLYNAYQHTNAELDESLHRKKKKAIEVEEESSSFTEIQLATGNESSNGDYAAYSNDESDMQEEVEVTEEIKKKKKKTKYESISLTDFFARKQDEKAAKLRMCIVQSGETLDHLAEKYEISVQQILRMNHLETHQSVSEGQVIYIPSYAGKK